MKWKVLGRDDFGLVIEKSNKGYRVYLWEYGATVEEWLVPSIDDAVNVAKMIYLKHNLSRHGSVDWIVQKGEIKAFFLGGGVDG